MATHLLRDYVVQNNGSSIGIDFIAYLLAIFCRRVLNYSLVGQTNFDLDSSTYLKASGTVAGQRAGINFGPENRFEVSIPVAVRTVTVGDIGRFLVLRSTSNPRFNSGAFLITGFNPTDNRYVVDYRSPDEPPAEPADSMSWWLYEEDLTFPSTRGPNAGPGYRSFGSSTCSRMVLQSAHSTGWQVRICMESAQDQQLGTNVTCEWTYAPGFGGDSAGDFAVGGEHLHSALWYNTNTTTVAQTPGQGRISSAENYRVTMVGDDELGVYCFIKRPGGPTNWHFQFGICEDEPQPVPLRPARRLFMMGHNSAGNSSQTSAGLVANSFHYHGLTQGFTGAPVSANLAGWTHIETNNAFGSGPLYNANAADNAVQEGVELLPLDMVAGMAENWYNQASNRIHQFEPRLMGRLPFVRAGRTNFTNFTLTVGKGWQHMQWDIYMMWGGPAILP